MGLTRTSTILRISLLVLKEVARQTIGVLATLMAIVFKKRSSI